MQEKKEELHTRINLVCDKLCKAWTKYHKQLITFNACIQRRTHAQLQDLFKEFGVGIELHVGMRNGRMLEEYKYSVELCISPLGEKDKLYIVDLIYNSLKNQLPVGLSIAKYKINIAKIKTIEFKDPDFIMVPEYIEYQLSYAIEPKSNKPLMNLVLRLDDRCINTVVEKKKVVFKVKNIKDNEEFRQFVQQNITSDVTVDQNAGTYSRMVWIPKTDAILTILVNLIGEMQYINVIGYIEMIPKSEDEKLRKAKQTTATEDPWYSLDELSADVENFVAQHDLRYCARCNHSSMHVNLTKCKSSSCDTYYCSALCNNADAKSHKKICTYQEPESLALSINQTSLVSHDETVKNKEEKNKILFDKEGNLV